MAPPVWAFQVENFEPPPHDELICSICQCVFCEPVECPCRHVFCSACIGKWIVLHRNCPICRKRTSEAALRPVNRIIKNLIMGLTLRCKNVNFGCDIRVTLEVCESHMKVCLYELEDCGNGCGKLVFRKDLVKHTQEECPFRRIKCNECGMNIEGTPNDHNCILALQQALQEKQKINDDLKEQLKVLKEKLNEKTKDSTNLFNTTFSSFDIDSLWSSCTSDSDSISSLEHQEMPSVSYSSSSADFSDVDDSEISVPAAPNTTAQSADDSHVSVSFNTANDISVSVSVPTLETMLMSPPHSPAIAGPSTSSGEDSANYRRPMKRRFDSPCFSSGSENSDEQNSGGRKAQRSSSSELTVTSTESQSERNDQTHSIELFTFTTNHSPTRHRRSGPRQRNTRVMSSASNSTALLSTNESDEPVEVVSNNDAAGPSTSATEEREPNPSVIQIFRRTLSLLRQHNIDSDPEWVPNNVTDSESESTSPAVHHSSSSDSSSNAATPAPSSCDDEQQDLESDSSSSYEVKIPTYDLLRRYCGSGSDSDTEWTP